MIALDTHVLLRFLVEDAVTPEHTLAAKIAIEDAISQSEPLFIPITVLSEVVWLLLRTVKLSKAQVAETLDTLVASGEIVLDQRGAVQRALMRWRNGTADYTDYLSYELAINAGSREILSFDKHLLRTPGVRRPNV